MDVYAASFHVTNLDEITQGQSLSDAISTLKEKRGCGKGNANESWAYLANRCPML